MKYKGFEIKEIYQSADGKGNHDYSIKPAISRNAPKAMREHGEVKMKTTIERIKELINEL